MQDPNKEERLKVLKKLNSWGENNRSDHVKNRAGRRCPVRRNPIVMLPMRSPDGLWSSKSKDPLVAIRTTRLKFARITKWNICVQCVTCGKFTEKELTDQNRQ
jgi:hypothetical protein